MPSRTPPSRKSPATDAKLRTALDAASPLVQRYVEALQAELFAYQERIALLELQLLGASNRVKILEKERKPPPPPTEHDDLDVARRIAFILARAGMTIVDAHGSAVAPERKPRSKPAARR